MDLTSAIFSIILVNFVAWLTPGPNMLAVISVAAERGRLLGIITGVGISCSSFIWSALAIFGVYSILEPFPDFTLVFKLFSATYLGWIGFSLFKSSLTNMSEALTNPSKKLDRSVGPIWAFKFGFFIGITNPKALIFFSVIVTAFVPVTAPNWFLLVIVILCGGLGIPLHAVTATIFSTRAAMQVLSKWRRPMTLTISFMFFCFAALVVL